MAMSFLGISLAWATFFAVYPQFGTLLRPLAVAAACASIVALGWISMPLYRPNPGAMALWVVIVWSLMAAAGIIHTHLHGGAMYSLELIVLSASVVTFFAGIYLSRYTRWGRKHFNRR